jgi:TRAP-type mannitol/chloroaromatic compound transport system substrate-binding protein
LRLAAELIILPHPQSARPELRGNTMKRREFLKAAGLGVATSAVAAPAVAQSMPEIKWRLTASWPKSLDTLYGTVEHISKRVAEITDNKFQIQGFAAGEIVPGLQVLDAVQNGTVEMGHTGAYYYVGKDPSFAFATALPFGLNSRQQESWQQFGGGGELLDGLFKQYNCIGIPTGNTGAQMGGWFRTEIKTLDDLKGLKFRIGGFAGRVVSKLGVVPQQLAPGDIYPSLEKGTIDAAEWVGPYDDEKLGFVKIAKYYYYPGWWEGGAQGHTLINLDKWNELPKNYQSTLAAVIREAGLIQTAKYDAQNPPAMKRLLQAGAQLRAFSPEILEASYKAAQETYAEIGQTNPLFKKLNESISAYRSEAYLWWQIAELPFDSFMIRMRTRT